jgi:lambda repressor-like predicted transcriptional regulator
LHQRLRRLPPDEVEQVVAAYEAGASVYVLADTFGIHRHTVSAHLHQAGVTMRRQGMTPEQVVEASVLYQAGWSLIKLGEKFGVDHETVRTELQRLGIRMRKPWERAR